MRVGVAILPEHSWSRGRAIWQRAEELGFDHAWTYDHLVWRSLRDSPWYSAIPTLTAAATVTERIRLGTLVVTPNFRHPYPLARELIALDDVSTGRLTLGIGAGAGGWDATILGQAELSPRDHADRFAEFVALLDRLLREREVSAEGRFFSTNEARTHPGCVQQPRLPFAIAARGPRGMALAARHGQMWVTTGEQMAEHPMPAQQGVPLVREQIDRLEAACAAHGRSPDALARLVLTGPVLDAGLDSVEAFRDTVGRYEEIGVTDLVVHWPRPTAPYARDLATFERIFSA